MPQPWERQEGETDAAYKAFSTYLAMEDDRSIRDAAAKDGGGPARERRYMKWSSQFSWVDRASAWEDHQAELVRQKLEKRRLAMAEKQSDVAEAMIEKVKKRIKNVPIKSLTPQDVARWVDVATRTERLALGEPTEIGKSEILMPKVLEVTLNDEGPEEPSPGPDESLEE